MLDVMMMDKAWPIIVSPGQVVYKHLVFSNQFSALLELFFFVLCLTCMHVYRIRNPANVMLNLYNLSITSGKQCITSGFLLFRCDA